MNKWLYYTISNGVRNISFVFSSMYTFLIASTSASYSIFIHACIGWANTYTQTVTYVFRLCGQSAVLNHRLRTCRHFDWGNLKTFTSGKKCLFHTILKAIVGNIKNWKPHQYLPNFSTMRRTPIEKSEKVSFDTITELGLPFLTGHKNCMFICTPVFCLVCRNNVVIHRQQRPLRYDLFHLVQRQSVVKMAYATHAHPHPIDFIEQPTKESINQCVVYIESKNPRLVKILQSLNKHIYESLVK